MATYRSKWGFHPCDKETYLKLKAISKWFWEYLHDFATFKRWDRKEPQNRVIRRRMPGSNVKTVVGPQPRPEYCPFFHYTDSTWASDFRNARKPREEAQVQGLNHSQEEIDKMYAKCMDWHNGKREVA